MQILKFIVDANLGVDFASNLIRKIAEESSKNRKHPMSNQETFKPGDRVVVVVSTGPFMSGEELTVECYFPGSSLNTAYVAVVEEYGRIPVVNLVRAPLCEEKPPVDLVNSPPHYTAHPSGVECIEITQYMGFLTGNAIKYLWRHRDKGTPLEDLKKARWYLSRAGEHKLSPNSGKAFLSSRTELLLWDTAEEDDTLCSAVNACWLLEALGTYADLEAAQRHVKELIARYTDEA